MVTITITGNEASEALSELAGLAENLTAPQVLAPDMEKLKAFAKKPLVNPTPAPAVTPANGTPGNAPSNAVIPAAVQTQAPLAGPTAPVPPVAQNAYPINPTQGQVPQTPAGSPAMTNQTMNYPSNPAPYQPAPAPAPLPQAPTAPMPTFTHEQVGAAGANLVAANPALMGTLMELLKKYGVQLVTELKYDQLGTFALELRGLGAKI